VRVLPDDSSAIYTPDGYLLFGRDNSLLALPFDVQRLRASGEATPVADGVGRFVSMYMPVTVSETGRLVSEARARRSRLVWHGAMAADRDYRRADAPGRSVASADGSEICVEGRRRRRRQWLDVKRGTTARVVQRPGCAAGLVS
jgi:hypothetical protein